MTTVGSVLLVSGIAGLIAYLVLLTVRPALFSRNISVAVIATLFLIILAALVLVTISSGGRSLHTGG
jgi:hypothetical protein